MQKKNIKPVKPKLNKGGIFGWPLDKVYSKVKVFVEDCIAFIEKHGMCAFFLAFEAVITMSKSEKISFNN
jgi:hypothetical protein